MNQTEKDTPPHMEISDILIDISAGNDARSFRDINEVIQKDAVKLFLRHVKSSIDKITHHPASKKTELSRYHDTIAVFGGRGTGKTTFILNLFKLISKASADDSTIKSMLPVGLEMTDLSALQILPILDPTLVEAKEHVFVNIISRIKEEVERHHRKTSGGYPQIVDPCSEVSWQETKNLDYNGHAPCSSTQGAYRDWLETLRTLAAGLPALDGIGGNLLQKESWQDPVHVMEEGLKCVRASNRLEENFHYYVAKSLEFIGKKAFVLAFDDVDTNFQAGWPVLEIIRKYLTTPQLITILSGDPGLYAKLIRKYQWKHFGRNFVDLEGQNSPRDGSRDNVYYMVDQLEDQYFLKILKPERRIELISILACQKRNAQVNIILPRNGKVLPQEKMMPLNDFIDQRIAKIWSLEKNRTFIKLYRDFLLDEPIRTLVQILTGMAEDGEENSRSRDALVETYFSNLYRHGFVTDIRSMTPEKALTRLAKALADNDFFDRGYRLKPEFFEKSANRLMLVLGAIYTRMIAVHQDLFFDYFIKIGLTRQISLSESGNSDPDKKSVLDRYMAWTGLSAGEDALTQSRFHSGFIRVDLLKEKPALNKKATLLGTIALRKYDAKSPMLTLTADSNEGYWTAFKNNVFQIYGTDDYHSVKNIGNKSLAAFHKPLISQVEKGGIINVPCLYAFLETLQDSLILSWQSVLIGLPGQFVVTADQEHTPLWSIHNLIASIGEITRCEDDSETGREAAMKGLLMRNSQLRAYDLPGNVESGADSDSEALDRIDEESASIESDNSKELDLFAKMLIQWRNNKPYKSLPVHIIAKIFARFYYSLGRVDDSDGVKYLGESFYRYIILFLNSVLVEEMLHLEPASEIGRKNPSSDDKNFNDNIKKAFSVEENSFSPLSAIKEKTPFFYWILSCPVWHSYLNPEEQLYTWIVGSSLYDTILEPEKIKYVDFLTVQYAAIKGSDSTVGFPSLYPVLNAILVQNMRVEGKAKRGMQKKASEKLPSWKIDHFGDIKPKIEPEIERLKVLESDTRTQQVITKYIEGNYTNVPRTPNGKVYERLKNEIDDMIDKQK